MRTVLLEISYDSEVDFTTVEALVDSMMGSEGVVAVSGRMATAMHYRVATDDDDEDDTEEGHGDTH